MSEVGVYRKIDVRIHNDFKYRQLSDKAKLLFLTILTHPQLTSIGAMKATQAGLAEEMGWELKAFREAFREETWKVSPNQEQEQDYPSTSPIGEVVDGPAAPSADPMPSPSECVDLETGEMNEPKLVNDTDSKAADGGEPDQPDIESSREVVDGGNGTGTKNRFTPNDLGRLWNETADPVFPRVILPLSEKRARKFRPAVRARPDPEWWKALFAKAGGIPFLKGENDRGWRADLEFVVRRREEILEGKYCRAKPKEEGPEWLKLISPDG